MDIPIHGNPWILSGYIHWYPYISEYITCCPLQGIFNSFYLKEKSARASAPSSARLPMDTPWLSLSMDIHKERLGGVLESGAPTWAPLFQRGSSPGPNFKDHPLSFDRSHLFYDRNQKMPKIILYLMIDLLLPLTYRPKSNCKVRHLSSYDRSNLWLTETLIATAGTMRSC